MPIETAQNAGEQLIRSLTQQVTAVRSKIGEQLEDLQRLSDQLRREVRRNPDISSGYLLFANANLRLAGALSNGLRRTASMDRALILAESDESAKRRDEEEADKRQAAWEQKRKLHALQSPSANDFKELYGDVFSSEDLSYAEE